MDPMEYIVPNRKRLPYGMMNFAVIRREDYYYVDKTRFIPMIEQADRFFFFIRPRRFGKSLTLNVLQHYYDVRTRDKFNDLFGDLYIGKHPTANRNSYLVLYLNFSGITGELNDYRKGLDAHCQIRFDFFCEVYSDLLPQGIRERLDEKDVLSTNWTIWFRSANVPDRKCISSSTNTTTSPTPSFLMPKACTATLMKRMAKVICVLSSIR